MPGHTPELVGTEGVWAAPRWADRGREAVAMVASIPELVRSELEVWLAWHDRLAPGLIEGLYLVGSVALDDWRPRSDIDIVALTADPATDADAVVLAAAHEAAAAELSISIDGPRLAWGDVSVPPQPLHRPWTLDGAFHHDGDCFEINPVTWYTLARYGIAVRGEPAPQLGVVTDADDRRHFVSGNVDTYWRSVGEQIEQALADPSRTEFAAETLEWCGLGVARMLYTFRTGDVASKSDAGRWAARELPAHAAVLELAVAVRSTVEPAPVDRSVVEALHELVMDTVRAIA